MGPFRSLITAAPLRRVAFVIGPLLVVGAAVAVIAAPGSPRRLLARSMPDTDSGRVESGADYRFTVYTHCGLDGRIEFDGSSWDYAGPGAPDDGSGNPPPGFDNPFDRGTMKLISEDVAEYRSSSGSIVKYRRRDGSKPVDMCM